MKVRELMGTSVRTMGNIDGDYGWVRMGTSIRTKVNDTTEV